SGKGQSWFNRVSAVERILPYRKCYGIDPEEFASFRDAPDSAIFMAYLDDQPVGHIVVSTNWNGFAHVDELAVALPARRH
ncbi:GNAT family N-acetyltransferase, partial [Klebsiella pneumoniae]|uniref:GNAT family N-acetyltransferase n=1 Tax=Klebsiella pneumoniae TaxID=573 RepID=UPI002731BACD